MGGDQFPGGALRILAIWLLCLSTAFAQVVPRTGDNAVKLPIVSGKRVTSTLVPGGNPGGGGGTLSINETFDTLVGPCNGNCGIPYDPPYNARWIPIGDPGCVRSVQNAVADGTGAFLSDMTVTDTDARHCGMNDIAAGQNMPFGTVWWIGWAQYVDGADANWDCTGINGCFNIGPQIHDAGSPAGVNPPINWSITRLNDPWLVTIQAKGERFIQYSSCGPATPRVWHIWVMRIQVSTPAGATPAVVGSVDVYHSVGTGTTPLLCIHDVGRNYPSASTLGPFSYIGAYYGQGKRSCTGISNCPPGERKEYFDQYRRGPEAAGVGFSTVVPQ